MTGGEELQAPCLAASEEDLPGHLPDLTQDPPEAGNHLDPLMEAWLKGCALSSGFPLLICGLQGDNGLAPGKDNRFGLF